MIPGVDPMKHSLGLLAAALLAAAPAFAANDHGHGHAHMHGVAAPANGATAAAKEAFADGEVKKVDKAAGKLTIKHGPVASIDMPPMTMVFRVKDAAMLDQVKAGDAIRFKAAKLDNGFTVTELQPAK